MLSGMLLFNILLNIDYIIIISDDDVKMSSFTI
jgi:hypothetical protein